MSSGPAHHATPAGKVRARGLGIGFDGEPGPWNAITDVTGLEVGHATVVSPPGTEPVVRTGITAVLPRGRAGVGVPCTAGWSSLNGNGELAGALWIEEAGTIGEPIALTTTHSVGRVHRAVVDWVFEHRPDSRRLWLLPVVMETWDGYLSDANGDHIGQAEVHAALDTATTGAVEQGCIGGGTGMQCYGFKGGIGTASRVVEVGGVPRVVGALIQANFGDREELLVHGAPVGHLASAPDPFRDPSWRTPLGAGSAAVVIATDAPLLPGQCKALARRVGLGLARTGTAGSHFSGDIFLAFSTGNEGDLPPRHLIPTDTPDAAPSQLSYVPWALIDPLFVAVVQAVEEAVVDALVTAEETDGPDGRGLMALPHDLLLTALGTSHHVPNPRRDPR
jgi:L-aminopeptidase/D-esterase-like protein